MSKESKAPEWADFFVNRVVWGLIVMVFLWIAITYFGPALILSGMNKDKMAAYGQVGDMFGMVNSLFSGMAFLAAIYAVILQTVEMREAGERQLEQEKIKDRETALGRIELLRRIVENEKQATKAIVKSPERNHEVQTAYGDIRADIWTLTALFGNRSEKLVSIMNSFLEGCNTESEASEIQKGIDQYWQTLIAELGELSK